MGSLSGWAYRKALTINHTDDGAQTNYQMMLHIIKGMNPTAGVITTDGLYTVHTYKNVGSASSFVACAAGNIEYLVVAGGGGGSSGGGGAGGYKAGILAVTAKSYTITVGAGGAGKLMATAKGDNGGNSSIDVDIVATGGGGGGYNAAHPTGEGSVGGSGGGGGAAGGSVNHGQAGTGTEGNAGSDSVDSAPTYPSGAGGGSGGAASGTTGGAGTANDILDGTPVTYAAGGNGCLYNNDTHGAAGAANTGNGGGGSSSPGTHLGGDGGSGIVIIRCLTSDFLVDGVYGNTSPATETAGTIYLNDHCLNWPIDILFTLSDGETVAGADFWREEYDATDGSWWLEANSIPAGGTWTGYIYYGKVDASDESDGEATFIFFDHFDSDLAKWSGDTDHCSVASSAVTITANSADWHKIYSASYSGNIRMRARANLVNVNYNAFGLDDGNVWTVDYLYAQHNGARTNHSGWIGANGGVGTDFANTLIGFGSYQLFDFCRCLTGTDTSKLFYNGVQVGSSDTAHCPDADLMAMIAAYNNAASMIVDWVFISNYSTTEPTWAVNGDEEAVTTITNQAVGGSLTLSGGLSRITQKMLAGAGTPSGVLAKLTSKNLAGSFPSGAYGSKDSFTPTINGLGTVYGTHWKAQTFKASASYKLDIVKLHVVANLTGAGTLNVYLKNVDVDGKPTGAVLSSGTNSTVGSIPYYPSGATWVDFAMSYYELIAGVTYALVIESPTANGTTVFLLSDNTAGGYADGNAWGSTNSGSTWTTEDPVDYAFDIYGTGQYSIAGALTKITAVSFAGAVTLAGSLVKLTLKPLAGAITPTGSLVRLINKVLSGAISSITGSLTKLTTPATPMGNGVITPSGSLSKITNKALAGAITPTGTLARFIYKNVAGAITLAGVLTRSINKAMSGSISPTGSLTKITNKILAGTITFSGSLAGLTKRILKLFIWRKNRNLLSVAHKNYRIVSIAHKHRNTVTLYHRG